MPLDLNFKQAFAGTDQALAGRNLTQRCTGQVMDGIDFINRGMIEHALVNHGARTKAVFLVRLEKEHRRAVKSRIGTQDLRRTQ